ncbi:YdcF family protein [Ramlibacter henchirensis]|uniref:YdcF family protein n=1 Tax=Ramlibacter henchirensis TaxID=204072 RepID=A0A4Z0C4Y6_9BURK|nr:YdcF family protein [Ramlibacter henchirensis]TFZ06004.1 YdcF family protein [Ramlibacter henchirensis]
MLAGELKPILAALALPPAGPLLLAALGLVLAARRWPRSGLALAAIALAGLWLLGCHAVGMLLSASALPQVEPVRPERLHQVQAIVVLGGGVLPNAPEYGVAQPSAFTLGRLRYAAMLARRTGKPLAFTGGIGWSSAGGDFPPESESAARTLQEFGVVPRWNDSRSRDTAENARELETLLGVQGVRRIALVTDAWHMPRAELEFRRAGFDVVAAPTGFAAPQTRPLLEWLPSAEGLALSRRVLREAFALWLARA